LSLGTPETPVLRSTRGQAYSGLLLGFFSAGRLLAVSHTYQQLLQAIIAELINEVS